MTYSAADLKGVVFILLENAPSPSVPDRRGHSPVLCSCPGLWGAQAAAAPVRC